MAILAPGPRRAFFAGAWLAATLLGAACSAPRRTEVPRAVPPRDPADAHLREGDRARREGRVDDAILAYDRGLALEPGRVPLHVRLVSTLLASGRRSEARERYEARAKAPRATEADRVMAARLATDGSAAAVRAVYLEAARASPQEPWWRL